ncbi:hypothetical protein [Herminiimonas sp.]|uniref:hypothetical protein n=1 Tax=Herminiimonas sp. TaxID=1926289 RepID=UPI00351CED5B
MICASVNRVPSPAAAGFVLLDLVANSRTFETTACSILSADPEPVFLSLPALDRDASLFGTVAATAGFLAAAITFFTEFVTALPVDFVPAAAFAAGLTLFTGLDFFAAGALPLAATAGDFTALLATGFFAALGADLTAGLAAALSGLAVTLTAFFANGCTADFLALLLAGFARATAAALGAGFFVFLTDFVAVAFIVPCP